MGPTGRSKILQVHPTRRCNLQCLHCYSSSSPQERDSLDEALLTDAVADAATLGYTVLSLSGGEPLLYPSLDGLLAAAKRHHLLTTVTTNGMLLTPKRLSTLRPLTDLLAISLDGEPASHNRLRAHPKAFETMRSRLPALRESGLAFGFIFTLTQHNLHELDWVAQFALDEGAKLLQIHPLEAVGRAIDRLDGERPDGIEASFAFLEATRLQAVVGDAMAIQVDLSHRPSLTANPERVYADGDVVTTDAPLAELVSPLIVEPDATVVPLMYGFSRRYALGNLHDARLRDLAEGWRHTGLGPFRQLCRGVLEDPTPTAGKPFFNWFEATRSASRAAAL